MSGRFPLAYVAGLVRGGGEGRLLAGFNHLPFPPRIGGVLRFQGDGPG
ncbi:MAG: hypothetical protein IN808_07580 [Rubrobacter sp.]|nr:hypothetical protein [Rubrobacter sp.]